MTTLQKTFAAVTFAAVVGIGFYQGNQASRLRDQVQSLLLQQAALTGQIERANSENTSLSNQLAQSTGSPSFGSERLRELLRLRGQVGVLRRQQLELEQALAEAQGRTAPKATQEPSAGTRQANVAAPFQVQLVVDEPGEDTEPVTNSVSGSIRETLHLNKTPLMDYTAIRSASLAKNEVSGQPQIDVELSREGKELFAAVTKEHLNQRLAILLNGRVYAAPVIRSEISSGKAQITGNFTEEEARELVVKINEAIR
jgi:hypothetical protein